MPGPPPEAMIAASVGRRTSGVGRPEGAQCSHASDLGATTAAGSWSSLWIVALFVGNGIAGGVGDAYRQDFSLEGFESTDGLHARRVGVRRRQRLARSRARSSSQAEQGVDDPDGPGRDGGDVRRGRRDRRRHRRCRAPTRRAASSRSPTQGDAAGHASPTPPSTCPRTSTSRAPPTSATRSASSIPEVDGLRVELGGFLFAEFEQPSAELFGLAFAIIILIVAFGSVLAMGLPVGVALFGIGLGGAFVILASHLMEVPDFAPFVGLMIGLGVGIDYALLIVTRYREQLHAGHDIRESIGIAMDTAGRSVVFAGATVVISLLGMLLMGIGFIGGLGITASLTVAVTVAGVDHAAPRAARLRRRQHRAHQVARPDRRRLRRRSRSSAPGSRSRRSILARLRPRACSRSSSGSSSPPLKREVQHRPPKPRRETVAYRWSRVIQHRPWPFAIGATAVLLVLAIPVLSLRLGFSDESNFADDTTTKQAYDLVVEGFGKGSTGPDLPRRRGRRRRRRSAALAAVNEAVAADPEVESVLGPAAQRPRRPDRGALARHPDRRPAGRGDHRRSSTASATTCCRRSRRPPGADVLVTGLVAANVDMSALHGRADADLLRRRAHAVVPAADGRVPVAARAAQGRDHEPAVDRRRLRRGRRPVPVGLAQRPHRRAARARSRPGCR